jgi:hypothetical protein
MRFILEERNLKGFAMTRYSRLFVSAVAALMISAQASAQLGGAVGGVMGGVGNTAGGVLGGSNGGLGGSGIGLGGSNPGALGNILNAQQLSDAMGPVSLDQVSLPIDISTWQPAAIADLRMARLNALISANPRTLDRDPQGQPVRKYELICTDPDAASLSAAVGAGFRVTGIETVAELGIRMVTLAVPKGMNVRQAYKALRKAAPALQVDYNHIYEPAGGTLAPALGAALASSAGQLPTGPRIAMIDGGVASHPSLARARVEQQGFAGAPQPTGHGTAVGSLLVGDEGPFRGAARGAQLFVGDVYGGNPAAGSVTTVIHALAWAASKSPAVINVSLVGPNNGALARAIGALRARGIGVTAAVGNDGPAAPPQYPASYPGVIAVTGVDSQGRALPEAGKPAHLDFAAPGADMVAALPGQGFTRVRGTSFAAPLAAARLALAGSYQLLAAEARPGKGRVGRGIVCADCRIDPKTVRAK